MDKNKKIKIVKICPNPKHDSKEENEWEVTVQINGETKKLEIYHDGSLNENIFLDYVRYKALYGDQWYDLHQKQKNLEKELQKLVGREIST